MHSLYWADVFEALDVESTHCGGKFFVGAFCIDWQNAVNVKFEEWLFHNLTCSIIGEVI